MAESVKLKTNIGAIINGNNLIAAKLHKALARNGKNVFISPLSLTSALAMLLHGLRSKTASELREFLGYEDVDNELLVNTFQEIISSFEKSQEGYTISYANSVVVGIDFPVSKHYIIDLHTYFKALCLQADFTNDSGAAVKLINYWVSKKTNSMITELLQSLDSSTVMVLLNAVYFKGLWAKQFNDKSTFMQYFYNDGIEDNANLVEMMHLKESFPFVVKDSFQALQLPYKGDEVSMLILLPNARDGLHEIEDLLTANFISEIKKDMKETKLQVALPKFRLEYNIDLNETFQELGVKEIFEFGSDFGGICSSKDIRVSQIAHKAVLEVSEEGCEAAAATAVVMQMRMLEIIPEFVVDHPFAFVIYNTLNDLIIFSGRVTEL